jgi:MSHA biogenesis protein MshL
MKKNVCLASVALISLMGCAQQATLPSEETVTPPTTQDVMKKAPALQVPVSPPRKSAMSTLRQPRTVDGRRFDVAAANAPAKAFFAGLVEGSNANVMVHPSVNANVSIQLKNVTLEEALEATCDLYELDYVAREYGYQVVPRKLQTRVFRVDYLDVSRNGRSSTLVSSGQVSFSESNSEGAASSSSTTNSETKQSAQIETESESEVWKNLKKAVRTLIGKDEGRSVVVDAQSGTIVVKALPSELRDVETFLARAQNSLQRQVLIEAKIVEVTLQEGSDTGIQWNTFGDGFDGTMEGSDKTVTGSQASSPAPNPLLDNTIEGAFSLAVNASDFTGVLRLLRSQGDVQVLSSPRIATVNNQKAVIKVGTDEFFVTRVSSSTTSNAVTTESMPEVTLTPFFSGIALDVTPQVGEDSNVILHVHPTVTEVTEKIKQIGLGEQDLELPLAFSSVRETDSVIKAADGQVVVIGGLMQNKEKNLSSSVALLSEIPILGMLFNQNRDTRVKSELVILLRPRVQQPDEIDWEQALAPVVDRER